MDNKFYYGLATEKQEAAEQFEARQEAGENVGLVEARYRKVVHAVGVNIYKYTRSVKTSKLI